MRYLRRLAALATLFALAVSPALATDLPATAQHALAAASNTPAP